VVVVVVIVVVAVKVVIILNVLKFLLLCVITLPPQDQVRRDRDAPDVTQSAP
jgi:hypothetical protein